jgi:hypothetical protein
MHTGVQHDFHIRWCAGRSIVARRVPHVEQELFTILKHQVRVTQSLVYCVVFSGQWFVLFLLVIVLSVLLRFTTPDYPFGIFKPFLCYRI